MFGIDVEKIEKEARDISEIRDIRKMSFRGHLGNFWKLITYSIKLMLTEKEILFFAFLQLCAIGAGYYLWVQILGWIPDEVYRDTQKSDSLALNLVFLIWSVGCVGLVAFPLSILSGCMGASHFLKQQGYPSTIANCVRIVAPRIRPLWLFYWQDSWVTVAQILDRLPKKHDDWKLADEVLYYAWKFATVTVLPSIIHGRTLIASIQESLKILIAIPKDIALLRASYSLLCWIIGLITYVGAFVFVGNHATGKSALFEFYLFAGVPILAAAAVIQILLRPLFVLASCKLYSDYMKDAKIPLDLPQHLSRSISTVVSFGVLVLIIAAVYFYREQIGVMKILRVE